MHVLCGDGGVLFRQTNVLLLPLNVFSIDKNCLLLQDSIYSVILFIYSLVESLEGPLGEAPFCFYLKHWMWHSSLT